MSRPAGPARSTRSARQGDGAHARDTIVRSLRGWGRASLPHSAASPAQRSVASPGLLGQAQRLRAWADRVMPQANASAILAYSPGTRNCRVITPRPSSGAPWPRAVPGGGQGWDRPHRHLPSAVSISGSAMPAPASPAPPGCPSLTTATGRSRMTGGGGGARRLGPVVPSPARRGGGEGWGSSATARGSSISRSPASAGSRSSTVGPGQAP